jgi:predicted nuclease of predicted toxin-antitoxin system
LLDNCVPRRLAAVIEGHVVECVVDLGWAALTDGELLDRMTGRYDALLTVDRGIRHQQRLRDRPFCIVLLRARTNRLADLLPLVSAMQDILKQVQPGEMREIGEGAADPPR